MRFLKLWPASNLPEGLVRCYKKVGHWSLLNINNIKQNIFINTYLKLRNRKQVPLVQRYCSELKKFIPLTHIYSLKYSSQHLAFLSSLSICNYLSINIHIVIIQYHDVSELPFSNPKPRTELDRRAPLCDITSAILWHHSSSSLDFAHKNEIRKFIWLHFRNSIKLSIDLKLKELWLKTYIFDFYQFSWAWVRLHYF